MALKDSITPVLAAIDQRFKRYKLIVLHPTSHGWGALLAALIEQPPSELYYHSLGLTDVSLDTFLGGLVASLAKQKPHRGQYLSAAQRAAADDIASLAVAAARELYELESGDYLLILDELDRADHVPAIVDFLESLLDALPPHCHLLVSSRKLPRLPWMSLLARGEVGILRDGQWVATE